MAVAGYSHVAGRDADHFALVAEQRFDGGEAGIDFNAERLGARAEPARHRAERTDEIAVIAHEPRHRPIGQAHAAGGPEHMELVARDRCLQRPVGILAPVGDQPVEADRVDDRPGEDMRADDRALLDDDDGEVRVELLEPNGGRQARGPAPTITTS